MLADRPVMEQRDIWRQQLQGLLLVVVVAIALRWGVVEPRWIPSESMQPGLQPQDRILVWKLGHRLGLSPNRMRRWCSAPRRFSLLRAMTPTLR